MNATTLQEIERNAIHNCNKYTYYNEQQKLVEQWEKDENGVWQNVTARRLKEQAIARARADFISAARKSGLTDAMIKDLLTQIKE